MNQKNEIVDLNENNDKTCDKCSNCSKCNPKPKVKKEKEFLPRDCNVCNVHYDDLYELQRFHGKKCRLCRNKAMLPLVKKKMEAYRSDERVKQYQNDYCRAYYRDKAELNRKTTRAFKPHKDRIYTPDRSTIKLANYLKESLTIIE